MESVVSFEISSFIIEKVSYFIGPIATSNTSKTCFLIRILRHFEQKFNNNDVLTLLARKSLCLGFTQKDYYSTIGLQWVKSSYQMDFLLCYHLNVQQWSVNEF